MNTGLELSGLKQFF